MMHNRIRAVLSVAALAGLVYNCTTGVSGVETTNGSGFTVSASATSIEGTAPPLSQIFVFDTSYIPYIDSGIGIGTSADGDGYYRIFTRPGTYTVFVISPDGEAAGIADETVADNNKTESASRIHAMVQPGSISGSIAATMGTPLLVYLAGMCHYELISDRRDFHFIAVPPGNYRLRIARLSRPDGTIEIISEHAVSVEPGAPVQTGEIK